MKITLRNIKHMPSMSEETTAYTATVYLDGKPFCEVSNDGRGGCDRQNMIAPFKHADLQVITSRLTASRPDLGTFEPFDRYCHECLMQHLSALEARRLLKMMQTSALIKLPNGDLMRIKGGTDESRLTRAKATYPNGILLNGMPEAELIKHLQ